MTRSLLKQSQYLVIGSGLLLLVLAGAAYRISSQHVASVEATLATDTLIRRLDELLLTLDDAETGQRGFLLTGEQRYLAPYLSAMQRLNSALEQVLAEGRTRSGGAERVAALRRLTFEKQSELRLTITLRQTQGLDQALAEVKTDRGMMYMDQLRKLIREWKDEESARFERRVSLQRRRQVELEAVLGLGVAVGMLFIFLSYRFSTMYDLERNASEEEIRQLNQSLESRVKERTAELTMQTVELRKRTMELQRSNADLSQFAYVASHDLQEPLRMVGSYMGLLARKYKGNLDETADVYIRYAIDGASRMQTLINDLLLYSRAGTQAVARTTVPLEAVVQTAMENLGLAIEESGAQIVWEALPVLQADKSKLTQVMQNLMANAIKFRRPGEAPRVEIAAKRQDEHWLISVRDNGIGFDPKYTDRIFQIFQRLHSVGKYPGTGMGLAICKRIVEHHGGQLWAESELGGGSIFFFTLPDGEVTDSSRG